LSNKTWRQSLHPRIDEARKALSQTNLAELALRGGLSIGETGLDIALFGRVYAIRLPEFVVNDPSTGEDCPEELQILLLDYLENADGTAPTGRWIGFQELPNGSFYRRAFQGYSGDQLVRDLDGDVDVFRRAAEKMGGESLELGDAAYAFRALPQMTLVVVWWSGDEEFPAEASVLFDETAGHYLPTDGLAILGRMLCRKLAKLGRET